LSAQHDRCSRLRRGRHGSRTRGSGAHRARFLARKGHGDTRIPLPRQGRLLVRNGDYTIDGYTYHIKASADGKFYWFYNNYNAETKPETVYEAFFIGTTGAYIELPAISGKALSKVILTGASGASGDSEAAITDTAGADIAGGLSQVVGKGEATYDLSGTVANTSYRITVTKKNCQFAKIELFYGEGGGSTPVQPTLSVNPTSLSFAAKDQAKTIACTVANADVHGRHLVLRRSQLRRIGSGHDRHGHPDREHRQRTQRHGHGLSDQRRRRDQSRSEDRRRHAGCRRRFGTSRRGRGARDGRARCRCGEVGCVGGRGAYRVTVGVGHGATAARPKSQRRPSPSRRLPPAVRNQQAIPTTRSRKWPSSSTA